MKPVVTYTAHSELRNPLLLLKRMLADLFSAWGLARILFRRDIKAKYQQSMLGYLWAFLPTIFTSLAFAMANSSRTLAVKSTSIPYLAFLILSMVFWQTFVEAINGPVQSISESKTMLAKVNFKREALLLAKFMEVWFNFVIKLVLVVAVVLYFDIAIAWTVVFVPLALTVLILLGMFIGLILAPLSLLVKDVSFGLSIFINFFLFVTPVVFPMPTEGTFAKVVKANPVTHLIEGIRQLMLGAGGYDFTSFLITAGVTLLFVFVAWLAFRLAMPFAIERVTS